MQNFKNKLINKINDSLVDVQNSSLLNVFNSTVSGGGGSQSTSDVTTNRSSDNSNLNDSEDDKLIQLFDEDNPDISSIDLVLSNQVVNETNSLGRVQQLPNKSNANRFNARKQENNDNYSKELSERNLHRHNQEPTTRHTTNNSILVDIGLVSDLDSAETESSQLKRFKNSLNPSRRHQNTSSTYANRNSNSEDDVPMLNPNYDRSHEDQTVIVVEERQDNSYAGGQLLASDHCHIPKPTEDLLDKRRHAIVWRKLIIVLILCIIFMVGEIVGGILANAIAIQTDAAHMAADIAGFFFSILAIYISTKEPTRRMSYGYHRSEILGALFSTLVIWVLTGVLVYLAIERTITQNFELDPIPMLVTAICGVFFNIIMYVVLHTNICFKGVNLGHHGHSHSGDGHGHGHSHSGGAHGHSHSHGHGHSHNDQAGHNHSHQSGEPSRSHSGSTSSGHNHYGALKNVDTNDHQIVSDTMPITDNYALGNKVECDHDHEPIIVQDQEIATEINDSTNINLRAAAIHVIGDFIQSIGVLIAAIVIYIDPENNKLADPICTFIFSVLVIFTTAPILRDIYYVLMEALPVNVNYESVMQDLCQIPRVIRAHNLHIWCLTMEKVALSVHLVTDKDADTQEVLRLANNMVRTKYKIEKTTIQVEFFAESMDSCSQCKPLLK